MTLFIQPNWPAPSQVRAYTTLRDGFNLPKSTDHTAEDCVLGKLFDLPEPPIWINQTHSNIVIPASLDVRDKEADAAYTNITNRVCVVLTADCLPVLLTRKDGSQVAAIHAGWRGLSAGIIENTIKAMQSPGEELLAWLGPAIGPTKFEVGQDVYESFTGQDPSAEQAFIKTSADKWLANLYLLARLRLGAMGVADIYGGDYCTHTQSELFFSYRRENGTKGRMASLIWIG